MAFQCQDCYSDKGAFIISYGRSRGPCENCGFTDLCVDAPFSIDPKWRENVQATLDKAGITQSSSLFHNKNEI